MLKYFTLKSKIIDKDISMESVDHYEDIIL